MGEDMRDAAFTKVIETDVEVIHAPVVGLMWITVNANDKPHHQQTSGRNANGIVGTEDG